MKKTEKEIKSLVNQLVKDYKKTKEVQFDELQEKIVNPYHLEADAIDKVMQKFEDEGISIVDENGDPAAACIELVKITKFLKKN